MRLRSLALATAAALLLLLATGGPLLRAQSRQQPQQPQQQRSLFQMFWQLPAQPTMRSRPVAAPPPVVRRRPAPVVVRDDPVIPKVDVAHHVVVMGDSLGNLLAKGLEEALNDRPDVAVEHRAKPDSGLVRTDFHDWPRAATELLADDQTISAAVIMLGLNDRQALREGDVVHEPLSPRWNELYRTRIEALAKLFAARRVPLIWVGLPPVQNGRLSSDYASLNDLYREQVEKAGGQYVDLWAAFVDTENRYTAMGPDVSGQTMRLRLGDGIHFTAAGSRKAAHFVDLLLRRMLEAAPRTDVIALPEPQSQSGVAAAAPLPGEIERMIDRMVAGLPTIALPEALRAKPLAGPILPLTGPQAGGGEGLLVSATQARGQSEAASRLDRIFSEGIAPDPQPGRMDDFRWPR